MTVTPKVTIVPTAITPVPTDEEAAAVVAAVELAWPRVAVGSTWVDDDEPNRWRFSGRWWSKPVPARRDRP